MATELSNINVLCVFTALKNPTRCFPFKETTQPLFCNSHLLNITSELYLQIYAGNQGAKTNSPLLFVHYLYNVVLKINPTTQGTKYLTMSQVPEPKYHTSLAVEKNKKTQ